MFGSETTIWLNDGNKYHLSIACVPEARKHCADPESAMFGADKLSKHMQRAAAWSSAGQLWFVLLATSSYFYSVAYVIWLNTLTI